MHLKLYDYFLKFPPKTIKTHRTHLIKEFHELNWIYLCSLKDGEEIPFSNEPFSGLPGTEHLEFQWFPIDQFASLQIQPSFLAERIKDLPSNIEHRIIHESLEK